MNWIYEILIPAVLWKATPKEGVGMNLFLLKLMPYGQ